MPSETYLLLREAILGEKQVTCVYQGCYREICPVIIGHTRKHERLLAYQFGGDSKSGLPPDGQWKCLDPSQIENVALRDGPWREGGRHKTPQRCVEDVDLDINLHVRKLR